MAGFCIEVRQGGAPSTTERTLRLVDLAHCTARDSFHTGNISAAWVHPEPSAHWWIRRRVNQLLLIEGSPDRLPRDNESLLEWLPDRWGSFRGFEISDAAQQPGQVTVFVDPVCSRPIFYRLSAGQLLVADKLATLALNATDAPSLDWDGVLEAMLLGSIYKYNLTSLAGAEEVSPGEALVFRNGEIATRYCNKLPEDETTSAEAVRSDPVGSLARALQKSVRECWTERGAALMLSGGLDSRAILALAGDGRRSVTLEMNARETELACQIAAACNAEFLALPFPAEEWLTRAQEGFWIANGARDTEFVNDIGLGSRLAPHGIYSIAHGYLFDTILKGWLIRPLPKHVDMSQTIFADVGPAGVHFRDTTSRASFQADKDVLRMLSPEGAQQAIRHLRSTAESLRPSSEGQLNTTFEQHVLGWVSKQVHYGCFLSWADQLDLYSPVFHPALWSWYRHTRAEDRYLGRAYRRALVALQHPAFAVADSNTGLPISNPKPRWTDTVQDQLWYRAVRGVWRRVRSDKPAPYSDRRAARFRSPEGRALMEFGLERLRDNPRFNVASLEQALREFSGGNDRPFEPLLTITGVAQWCDLVARSKEYAAPQIQEVK